MGVCAGYYGKDSVEDPDRLLDSLASSGKAQIAAQAKSQVHFGESLSEAHANSLIPLEGSCSRSQAASIPSVQSYNILGIQGAILLLVC